MGPKPGSINRCWRSEPIAAPPPDAFAPEGTELGLAPDQPSRALRASGYELIISCCATISEPEGPSGLDHVMAFCPSLLDSAREGPRLRARMCSTPLKTCFGRSWALESVRSKTPSNWRRPWHGPQLGQRTVGRRRECMSYRVFYFERGADGAMKSPGDYPAQSLACGHNARLADAHWVWSGEDLPSTGGG